MSTKALISDYITSRPPETLPLYPLKASVTRPVKIPVMDFYLNPAALKWKGKQVRVGDIELFNLLIAAWKKEFGWSKQQAYDEFFQMTP